MQVSRYALVLLLAAACAGAPPPPQPPAAAPPSPIVLSPPPESSPRLVPQRGRAWGPAAVFGGGRWVLAADDDRRAHLWDVQNGTLLRSLEGHTEEITGVLALPDGKRALTTAMDGTLRLWDLVDARPLRTTPAHRGECTNLRLSESGRRAMTKGGFRPMADARLRDADGRIVVWEVESGAALRVLGPFQRLGAADLSSDGSRVLAQVDDGLVLFDVDTGARKITLKQSPREKSWNVTSVVLARDGSGAAISRGVGVELWDLGTGEKLAFEGEHEWPHDGSFAFTPDGLELRIASSEGITRVHLTTGKTDPLAPFSARDDGMIRGTELTPDARYVLAESTGSEGMLLLDAESGAKIRALDATSERVGRLAVSPDGAQLLVAGVLDARVWDLQSLALKRIIEGQADDVAFSTDGRRAFVGGTELRAFGAAGGELLGSIDVFRAEDVAALSATRDGRRVVSGGVRSQVVWDMETRKPIRRWPRARQEVLSVAISGDGRRVLDAVRDLEQGGQDDRVELWDVETGERLQKLSGHAQGITATAFLPGERRAVSAGRDGAVIVWDLASGAVVRTMKEPDPDEIQALAISPDGKRAATGGGNLRWTRDTSVTLWDLETGRVIRKLQGHTRPVVALAFLPDGQHVASSSEDRTVRLWSTLDGASVALMAWGKEWLAFTDDGYFASSPGGGERVAVVQGMESHRLARLPARDNRPDLLLQRVHLGPRPSASQAPVLAPARMPAGCGCRAAPPGEGSALWLLAAGAVASWIARRHRPGLSSRPPC